MDYIITPTFQGHFRFVREYLISFCTYVEDPENVQLCFTVSKNEEEAFKELIAPFEDKCQIKLCIFDDILKAYHIAYTPEELIARYGKFTFQTFKKFLTILYVNAERSLILDSESMWIRPTNMRRMFDEYFKKPYLTVSSIADREWDAFTKIEISNIGHLLNMKCTKWPLENFVWFYDIRILKDLFDEYGSLEEMADEILYKNSGQPYQPGIFEILLYQEYILKNRQKYGYQVIEIDQEINAALSQKDAAAYKKAMLAKYNSAGGYAEHASEYLTPANYMALAAVMKNARQVIVRCDRSQSFRLFRLQKSYFHVFQPHILAASQEHFFGPNQTAAKLISGLLKGFCTNVFLRFRSTVKKILLEVSPAYRASTAVRFDLARFSDAANCRMDRLEQLISVDWERMLNGQPNNMMDNRMRWELSLQDSILHLVGKQPVSGKRVLIVDGAYGDLALQFIQLGYTVCMTERWQDRCSIARQRLPQEVSVLCISSEKEAENLAAADPFDLIVDMGQVFYHDMPFFDKWMALSDCVVFAVHTEYVNSAAANRESTPWGPSEENWQPAGKSHFFLSLLQKAGWHTEHITVPKQEYSGLPQHIVLCKGVKEREK